MDLIIRKWRITEMSMWDKDFIDLIEPGCIEFADDGLGSLHFGAVYTHIDYRISELNQIQLIEFSFSGEDEGDPICGRAKLTFQGQQLKGNIFFHCGDESELIAQPFR